jgi:hypothetical protein
LSSASRWLAVAAVVVAVPAVARIFIPLLSVLLPRRWRHASPTGTQVSAGRDISGEHSRDAAPAREDTVLPDAADSETPPDDSD